ncbi:transposase, IS4 family [Leptospira weilii str. Ecochallenge]|uniref:Transposase, IS4 family n=3 Tax=Leptospira weilii TaxID=28184 RepID=N1UGU8_9LEPT|nr:transposase [Leptospira weilii]EMY15245.1 transposase, IS4 family [Leptospira weilii str. Ecochallenge]EMY15437.1 transposase, IS4 family [Leptospira weilii str. Ecochallenge]
MAKFKNTDPNQLRMHVLDFQELFGEGHPIHGFKKVIDRIDFEAFERNYQNDETGRPAISPKKVVSALFYSILIGNLSMRELCRLSKLRAELIYLLDGEELDHTFISKFRKIHKKEMQNLFSQTVFLGYESGFINFETISIDGTKIKANANPGDIGDLEKFETRLKQIEKVSKKKFKEWEQSADLEYSKIQKKRKELERKTDKLKEAVDFLKKHEDRRRIHLYERNCDLQKRRKGFIVGYNAQAAVDCKSKMIISQCVETGQSDTQFAEKMIQKVESCYSSLKSKDDDFKKIQYVLDAGYSSEANFRNLKEFDLYCPDRNITRLFQAGKIPKVPKSPKRKPKSIRFTYEKKSNQFICPTGRILKFRTEKFLHGKDSYSNFRSISCSGCHLKRFCSKGRSKSIFVISRNLKKNYIHSSPPKSYQPDEVDNFYTMEMRKKLSEPRSRIIYSKRFSSIEGVFGAIKGSRGGDLFLTKGIEKVSLEWSERCSAHNIAKLCGFRYV